MQIDSEEVKRIIEVEIRPKVQQIAEVMAGTTSDSLFEDMIKEIGKLGYPPVVWAEQDGGEIFKIFMKAVRVQINDCLHKELASADQRSVDRLKKVFMFKQPATRRKFFQAIVWKDKALAETFIGLALHITSVDEFLKKKSAESINLFSGVYFEIAMMTMFCELGVLTSLVARPAMVMMYNVAFEKFIEQNEKLISSLSKENDDPEILNTINGIVSFINTHMHIMRSRHFQIMDEKGI